MPDKVVELSSTLFDQRYRLLVESIHDYAIFMLDPHGYVLTWNAGAERIEGYRAEEIIGRHFSTFYPQEAVDTGHPDFELRVAAETGRFEEEGWRVRHDGSLFWANVVITAMRDATGHLCGFGKITRDLTRRREQEESLRQSEEQLRLLIEGVSDYAIFMLDPNGYIATWNLGAQRIIGYDPGELKAAGRNTNCRSQPPRVGSRKKAGGYARTAHNSGPAASSPRCATNWGACADSPSSRETSPSGDAPNCSRPMGLVARNCSMPNAAPASMRSVPRA